MDLSELFSKGEVNKSEGMRLFDFLFCLHVIHQLSNLFLVCLFAWTPQKSMYSI